MEHIEMCCIVYLDDVLIYSNTLQQHRTDVSNILEAIRRSGMKVKPSKCEFHQSETEYLGFIIGQEGVKTDPTKTQAIWDWMSPKKIKEIQCFLGFCNFYRRFIEGFSRTAKPLYAKTKKESIGNWEWGDKEQKAFDELRTKLTTAPVLVYFNPLAPTKIETDASKYVCSGILSQQCQDGKWRPVAYRSKTMSDAECNYDIHDKELLPIVQVFYEWKRYTRGNPKPIRVLTDQENLVTFMTTKELNERQARRMQELSQYNFKIEYRPGKEGGKPDALTRREGDLPTAGDKRLTGNVGILLPKERCWNILETEDIKLEVLETTEFQDKDEGEIQKASNDDDEIQNIKKNLHEGKKEMKGIALGPCQWKNGLLWYQGKIWIPNDEGIRTTLIAKHHDPPQAGHGGMAKTTELIKRRYYWPKIREDITRFIKNCDTCQRTKVVRHAPYGLLQSSEAPDRPWKSIAMDFITDLPKSEGYDTILVVIDRLTKMSHFIPCSKDLDAWQFANLFMKEIVRLHGLPHDIITDRGTLFTADLRKETMGKLGI